MCTTPKSSKAAKPRSRSSATNPDSYRNNLVEMQQASNHFDEFDRDAEQFRHLARNKNKKLDSADAEPKNSSKTGSWMMRFRGFWQRLF